MANKTWTINMLILFASLFIPLSCAQKKETVKDAPGQGSTFTMPERMIRYTRGSCFGKCPVFELIIFNDGKAFLDAKMNMDHKGLFGYSLTRAELTELNTVLEKTDFQSMKDTYFGEIADVPAVGITVRMGKKEKKINGNWQFPEELLQVFRFLDKYVHSEKWMPAREKDPFYMQSESIIPDRIIVDLDRELEAESWIKRYQRYGGAIVKRIAPRLHLYVLRFDPDEIHPAQFLEMLRNDPAVKNVEFDKQLKMRD